MVAPALAVTGITASSTIGVFDSLPEYVKIDALPERNTIWAAFSGEGNVDGYYPIATVYNQNRQEVPYDEISQFVLDATVDGEDSRFFEHGGVDIASVIRAGLGNVVGGDVSSGASTLSMQVVKNIYVQGALEEPTLEERDADRSQAWGHLHLNDVAERADLFENEVLVLTHLTHDDPACDQRVRASTDDQGLVVFSRET